jgi:hypothetical protein
MRFFCIAALSPPGRLLAPGSPAWTFESRAEHLRRAETRTLVISPGAHTR